MSSAVFLRSSIRVTIELEDDNELPFLEIPVKRGPNNTFVTSINRKKTFIGLYTKWRSFNPRKYKTSHSHINLSLLRTCSSSLLQSVLDDRRKLLLQNGYLQGIINHHVNDNLNRHRNKQGSLVRMLYRTHLFSFFIPSLVY